LRGFDRANPKPPFLSDQMSEVEHGEKAGESVTFALLRPLLARQEVGEWSSRPARNIPQLTVRDVN
jgi:hypothetical protein